LQCSDHRRALIVGDDWVSLLSACCGEYCVMNGVDQLRQDLAFVDRMIAECHHHIARLQRSPPQIPRDAQETDLASDVLASFTAALRRYEAERSRVVSAMAGNKPIAELVANVS
jgi:hypothetical protein